MVGRWDTYDPFNMIEEFRREIDRIFDEFMKTPLTPLSGYGREPLVDIFKNGDELKIVVELPGFKKEDINVKFLDKQTVLIRAESRNNREMELEKALHVERYYGVFERIIRLPYPVIPETAKARYKNGILEITVKIDKSLIKQIEGVEVKVE